MLLFDIVIPTYNNLNELKECLDSFSHQTIKDYKIWVCVDGSTDGTLEYLSEKSKSHPQITFLEHADKQNHGRAATRNLILSKISAKYVLFLDSDYRVPNKFLEGHFSVLQLENRVSVGQVTYERNNIWSDYDLTRGMHKYKKNLSVIPAKYIVTDNVAMPSFVFLELKGFDEHFRTYGGEDTELGYRIQEKYNLPVVVNKKALAFGSLDKSLAFALQQREEFAGANLKYLLNKHPWATDIFNIRFINSVFGKALYFFTPKKMLLTASENEKLPHFLRLKFVHLLVFCYLFKGYHKS